MPKFSSSFFVDSEKNTQLTGTIIADKQFLTLKSFDWIYFIFGLLTLHTGNKITEVKLITNLCKSLL